MTKPNNKRKDTTMNLFLKQLSLAVLTCTLTLGTAATAHATSFFDYVGTGSEFITGLNIHTVTGFVELSIAVPVPGITDVALSDVVDSGFSVSGPIYNFTLSHVDLSKMKASISPPDNISCNPSCEWFDNSMGIVLLNGFFIAGDDSGSPLSFGMGSWTFRTTGNNPIPEPSTMILLGTGFAGIIAWRRKQAV